ncbi:MAG: PEGA domain-containing protein [Phycisphaeraceae bacterium]|nr:PEGA domain-containing protein [Phycisphaeraceae bacterium]
MMHRARTLAVGTMALAMLAGCVERRITITSNPSGALVRLNDEEVGRTPLTVPFKYYGVYDVRLNHDGYKPLWTTHEAKAPWWELPGPDLAAEFFTHAVVELPWHFDMEVAPMDDENATLDRASQMRSSVQGMNEQNKSK